MTAKEIEELAGHRQVPAWVVKLVGDAVAAQKKEWVGLTLEEIKEILDCGRPDLVNIKKAEQKLKEKNGG
jgi:hypothetical protein